MKTLLTKLIKDNKQIIFNGNNYADEWQKDAAKRGLLNHKTSVDAFGEILKPDVIKAFEKYGVLNERELKARYEVALEQYNKTINIEAQLMVLMANRYILPAAYRFEGELAQSVAAVKAAGVTAKETRKTLEAVSKLTDEAKGLVDKLQHLLEHEANGDIVKHAKYFRDKVDSGDDRLARGRRWPRRPRAARRLAAPDVPGDAVRQVTVAPPQAACCATVPRRTPRRHAGPFSFPANPHGGSLRPRSMMGVLA